MRPKFIFSLCSMVLAAALVVGGFSPAWFTDGAISSGTPAMYAGTVDLAITPAQVDDTDWEACRKCRRGHGGDKGGGCRKGKCARKEFSWTLENTGTQAVYFRARPVETIGGSGDAAEGVVDWKRTDHKSKWEFVTDPGDSSQKNGWWYYCRTPVPDGETVELQLTGSLPRKGDVESGKYEVRLEAEAVQASEEAIGHEWPDYPRGVD